MSSMRGTQRDHESNLDALLEDLQTTVSRSNSSVGVNGQQTGYRSFRRTVTDGTPEGTSSDYHIEYLNPANSTHQVVESSYNSSSSNYKNDSHKYRGASSGSSADAKLKHNISELDSLLDDLNAAQKRNFSSSVVSTSHNSSGIDSGLMEPATSTPASTRMIQKHFHEEKSTLRGRSPSPRGRELVFTGTRSRDPSPVPVDYHTSFEQREQTPTVQQFYRYEKTTSTRTTAPVVTTEYPSNYDPNSTLRSYNYSEENTPLAIRDRSPSPINNSSRNQHNSYSYSSSRDVTTNHDRVPMGGYPRETEPDSTPRYGTTKSAYSYSSSTTRESRSDQKAPPPPHRSPSPVSFQQPPLPGSKNSRTYTDSSPPPTRRSQSPQRFSPSDPSHKLTYNVSPPHGSHTYKYTSSTTTSSNAYHDEAHNLKPRPFPTSPGEQQPPKKLDELMATLSDGSTPVREPHLPPPHDRYSETNVHRYTSHHTSSHHNTSNGVHHPISNGHPPGTPVTPEPTKTVNHSIIKEREAEKEKLLEKEESKGLAGPPVYYPPGVELFTKKDEAMMQKQEGGNKYKAMAKYEYEAKSKSKHSESSGKAVVPVCLPVCCAMPCTIM